MNSQTRHLEARVPEALAGKRLDQALALLFPDYSRARLSQWIRTGQVWVDDRTLRPKDKVMGGEAVRVEAVLEEEARWEPQAIELSVVYEDEALLVIDKPAGLVVHPAAGNPDGTLLNAVLHHAPQVAVVPRAGIVHRLDKETTGLMVVAKTVEAQTHLVQQLQSRSMGRTYLALVVGTVTGGGTVEAPIGRHPVDRKRQAVTPGGRPAVTHYRLEERFPAHTLLRVSLETGRTHQIRVHLAHIGYPIVGDPVYGGRLRLPAGASEAVREALRGFRRQALHAAELRLVHPLSGEEMSWTAPLPADMAALLEVLRRGA